MENFLTKNLKRIVIANLCLLALFLLAQTFSTFADISLKKKMANKGAPGILGSSGITFSATASVKAKPDVANFFMTVREEAEDNVSAQQKMTDKSNKAMELLEKEGIDKKDIKTNNYNTYPKYSSSNIVCIKAPCEPTKSVITGYEAMQNISFKIRDISKSGDIVTKLAALQVNDVQGPNFAIEDTSEAEAEARSEAIKEAKEKAQKIAKELGITLGKITAFSDSASPYQPYMEMGARGFAAKASSRAPNMESGEQEVSSTVSITYEIK
ncbi:MAG: SIMPL domain-containing protein [Rickettsiales bacterium]|nr:SIMPL domain-containing protein [Rickettsiales bacterium]